MEGSVEVASVDKFQWYVSVLPTFLNDQTLCFSSRKYIEVL